MYHPLSKKNFEAQDLAHEFQQSLRSQTSYIHDEEQGVPCSSSSSSDDEVILNEIDYASNIAEMTELGFLGNVLDKQIYTVEDHQLDDLEGLDYLYDDIDEQ